MEQSILMAFALLLVFEGLMPLFAPAAWRDAFTRIMALNDGQLRFVGLASVAAGLAILALAR